MAKSLFWLLFGKNLCLGRFSDPTVSKDTDVIKITYPEPKIIDCRQTDYRGSDDTSLNCTVHPEAKFEESRQINRHF